MYAQGSGSWVPGPTQGQHWHILSVNWRLTRNLQQWQWVEAVVTYIAKNAWKWLEINQNYWKWLEMAEIGEKYNKMFGKLLEMAGNGWQWLTLTVSCWKRLGKAENSRNL